MQNPNQTNLFKQKKQTSFKKWLPAILLAIAIHTLLLFVFINTHKATKADTVSKPKTIETSKPTEDLGHEKEVLLTLIEEHSKKTESIDKEDESAENKLEDKSDINKEAITATTNAKDETTEKGENDNKQVNKSAVSKQQPKQQDSVPPVVDASGYVPQKSQPQINPNDAVLLPRDVPKAEHNPLMGNESYSNMAEQSQDLNDQLSSVVNEVKEQKLHEIEAQQQASKDAYLKSQTSTPN